MIGISSSGSFKRMESFFGFIKQNSYFSTLEHFGSVGVNALAAATPVDTGLTAGSWAYTISRKRGRYEISWHNTNTRNGAPVAILLQYGHGTGTGGWVEGRNYINPAIQPIFDQMADEVWKQVTRA